MIHASNARQYSGWLATGLPLFDSQKVQCFIYFPRCRSTKSRSGYGKSRVCTKGTLPENFCDFPPEYYDKLGHDHFQSRPFLFIIPNHYRVTHESLCTSAETGAVPHIEHCEPCRKSVRVPSKAYRDRKYGTVTVT